MNERDLLELIRSIHSLSHKYDEDTEYHHVAYHTLLRCFMLFRQGDYINLEYKQRFKEQIEVLETYNGGGPIWGQPGRDGKGDSNTGTGHGGRRGRRKIASVDKGEIPGDRLPTQLIQASVR